MPWRGPRHLETEGGQGDFLTEAKLNGEESFRQPRHLVGRRDGLA